MYELVVRQGDKTTYERIEVERASQVLQMIPALLERHADCDRVEVRCGDAVLFSVDCAGNRVAG